MRQPVRHVRLGDPPARETTPVPDQNNHAVGRTPRRQAGETPEARCVASSSSASLSLWTRDERNNPAWGHQHTCQSGELVLGQPRSETQLRPRHPARSHASGKRSGERSLKRSAPLRSISRFHHLTLDCIGRCWIDAVLCSPPCDSTRALLTATGADTTFLILCPFLDALLLIPWQSLYKPGQRSVFHTC